MSKLLGITDSQLGGYALQAGQQNAIQQLGAYYDFDSTVVAMVAGEHSIGSVGRIDGLLATHPTTTRLAFSTGGNDIFAAVAAGTDNEVLAKNLLDNWAAAIDKCEGTTKPALSIFSPATAHVKGSGNFSADQYNARLEEIIPRLAAMCHRNKVHYVPVSEAMLALSKSLVPSAYESFWIVGNDEHCGLAFHDFVFELTKANSFLPHGEVTEPPPPPPPPPGGFVLISPTLGTTIGTMTANAGLSALRDGNLSKNAAQCAAFTATGVIAWAGVQYPAARTIRRARVKGSLNEGISTNAQIEVQVWKHALNEASGAYIGGSGTVNDANGFDFSLDINETASVIGWRILSTENAFTPKYAAQIEFYE